MGNNSKRVCIGQTNNNIKYTFQKHLEALRETFTPEKVERYGLSFNTEILRDLLSGGKTTSTALLERMNDDLMNDKSLPVFRKEKERVYKELLDDFESLCKTIKRKADEYPYILPEYYYIAEGTNFIDVLPNAFGAIDEAGKIYIDNPETIEVYKQCLLVAQEFEKLKDMIEPYSCYPMGIRGVLEYDSAKNVLCLNNGVLVECHSNGIWKRMFGK